MPPEYPLPQENAGLAKDHWHTQRFQSRFSHIYQHFIGSSDWFQLLKNLNGFFRVLRWRLKCKLCDQYSQNKFQSSTRYQTSISYDLNQKWSNPVPVNMQMKSLDSLTVWLSVRRSASQSFSSPSVHPSIHQQVVRRGVLCKCYKFFCISFKIAKWLGRLSPARGDRTWISKRTQRYVYTQHKSFLVPQKAKQGPARPMMRPLAIFSFYIFLATFSFLHSPRPSFVPVPPSSSSVLQSRPTFFLVQHCVYHLESVKVHFSSILTKALPTNQPTDRPTNLPTNWRTDGPTNGLTDKASYRDADASKNKAQRGQWCVL